MMTLDKEGFRCAYLPVLLTRPAQFMSLCGRNIKLLGASRTEVNVFSCLVTTSLDFHIFFTKRVFDK